MHDSNPYDPAAPANDLTPAKPSNLRGCGYGCLYSFGMWLGLSIVVAVLTPVVFSGPDWDLEAIARVTGGIVFLVFAVPTGVIGFIKGRQKPTETTDADDSDAQSTSQTAAGFGIIAGWVMLGAIVGVVVAIFSAEEARDSGAIIGAWTVCGGAIGWVMLIASKLLVRNR